MTIETIGLPCIQTQPHTTVTYICCFAYQPTMEMEIQFGCPHTTTQLYPIFANGIQLTG